MTGVWPCPTLAFRGALEFAIMTHVERLVTAGLLALAAAACSPAASREDVTAAETPAQIETPGQAAQTSPAAYRGAAVAAQVCAECHDVGMGAAAAVNLGAPDFKVIADRPESTAAGLAAWMLASHPRMPNYLFSEAEVTDLAAYIVSLRAP